MYQPEQLTLVLPINPDDEMEQAASIINVDNHPPRTQEEFMQAIAHYQQQMQRIEQDQTAARGPGLEHVAAIEAAFDINRITSDLTKFKYVILNLDSVAEPFVSDLITNPPEHDKYAAIKSRMLSMLAETSESKMRKLLRGAHITDQRPTHLLQNIRSLAEGQCNDSILRILFLDYLPEQVRTHLVISKTTDLNKLAQQADEITDIIGPTRRNVYAVEYEHLRTHTSSSSDTNVNTELKDLKELASSNSQVERHLIMTDGLSGRKKLVDTGSTVSVISKDFYKEHLKPTPTNLYAANSSIIHTHGHRLITLNLGLRRVFKWLFLIADVDQIIVGVDFLAHYGLLPDLRNRRLLDPLTNLHSRGWVSPARLHSISTVDTTVNAPSPFARLLEKFLDITIPALKRKPVVETMVAHHIVTDGPPVAECPRKLSGEKLQAAKDAISYMLEQDRYSPPLIQDLFPRMRGRCIFSVLDLAKAYYQIPMAAEDIQKTAMTTPFGLYEFLAMPFGLKGATQTFQRFIDGVFRDLESGYGLTINVGKCVLGSRKVTFLSYEISPEGYRPTSERVQAILKYPHPATIQELRRFLGMVNYYRTCLPGAAHLQALLNAYLKGARKNDKRVVQWNQTVADAFARLRDLIADTTRLTYPSATAPLALITDASEPSNTIGLFPNT
ncbi:uncharacterized protein LOC106645159 [Copidosoma floridanum]|uniref:uncharacterized protein LOC106645159 n=1 Tax=Copidosoma floridanum TaxID=29053 RepID=UPI0006C94B87|nr:uncharacterized protein LOC106645159 [Copidosoma floridanum]